MPTNCRLYLITPPTLDDLPGFVKTLGVALDAGDVACLQLRLKDRKDDDLCRIIDVLRPEVQRRGVAFILNDRPDLAFETGCDGVHIGQEDSPYRQAREAVGANAIVGVTCHDSRHLAMLAGEQGADYVAFGAFYPTATKDVLHHADPEILSWWSGLMEVPCVAIGGITVDNAAPLIDAGADFLAVSGGVWNHPDGAAAAVRAFNKMFAAD
ncbi:thiamine phosphate synthase [Telmatospirillum sp.]|uniref:thiamine phosphate synthase n=1 Tax=Telmatospirillum sp. TaxID=2079197 RepID=UPI0028444D7F|nr:thiamine phosphate synthase [Telmatospirillum sp.]MDR3437992.1 thiamine phosphate synthase [Telmatospirillum sp.]